MAENPSMLRMRTQEALAVLKQARAILPELELVSDERTATALPLALAAMDTAESIYALLIDQPESYWMSALILQRAQMEFTLRAAFFAGAASLKETEKFRRSGKMPNRGKNKIYVLDVAKEAASHLGWDKDHLLRTVKAHYKSLSGLVHGGKEVLAIYTMNDSWGDLTLDWDDLIDSVVNILVFVMLDLAVAMSQSPLDPESLDRIVRPVYESASSFFNTVGRQPNT